MLLNSKDEPEEVKDVGTTKRDVFRLRAIYRNAVNPLYEDLTKAWEPRLNNPVFEQYIKSVIHAGTNRTLWKKYLQWKKFVKWLFRSSYVDHILYK